MVAMETVCYIGLGSNQGDKLRNCREAVDAMGRIPGCRIAGVSRFYRTAPVGVENQDWYVNGVAALSVRIFPRELLEALLDIERRMGRVRTGKWGPRTIDLDILAYGNRVIEEPDLVIPHPLMHLRRFVLVPLADLSADWTHPVLGTNAAEILEGISEKDQRVLPLEDSSWGSFAF